MSKGKTKKPVSIWPQFIAYWSEEGLESIIDIEALQKEHFFNLLKVKPGINQYDKTLDFNAKMNSVVSSMMLRARYNHQRHYEIYAFNAQEGIDKETIEQAFHESPQTMADTIRRIGKQIFSDRRKSDPVIK